MLTLKINLEITSGNKYRPVISQTINSSSSLLLPTPSLLLLVHYTNIDILTLINER